MIARESDLDMRAACQVDASSNLHAGEKSPDFAIKSGLDVSFRVSKLHQPLTTTLSISPSGTGADALISTMSRCEIKPLARSPEWYDLYRLFGHAC